MRQFAVAAETIARALESGQIGQPVAARVVANLPADHGRVERLLELALEQTAGWIESPAEEVNASGSLEGGQITALVRFSGGQSALVSAGVRGVGPPRVEMMLVGNRGILSWQPGDGCSTDPQRDDDDDGQSSHTGQSLLPAVQESLRTGGSIHLGPGNAANTVTKTATPGAAGNPVPQHQSERPAIRITPQQPPYGVLLVAGDHTHQPGYAAALAADPRCRLVGLTDEADLPERRRGLNEQLARRLGIPLLPDLRKALSRDDVEIVSICAEPRRRGRIIVEAARAGKHLYLDKPLAATLEEADQIVAAVRQAGVVSHMWSLVRTGPAARVQQLVRSGELGELQAIHMDLSFAKGPAGTARLGRRRKETPAPDVYELVESKRELTNVGVYPLVTLFWLLGQKVRRVSAGTGNYFFREHEQNDMEDFGQMLLELDDGLTASVSAGRTGWRSHPAGGVNRTCLIGTKAACTVDAYQPRVEVWADVEPWTAPQRDPDDPMGMWGASPSGRYAPRPKQSWITPPSSAKTDAAYFLDCIEQGRPSDVPASLAAAATEVLLAGYQSAAAGRPVELPLPRENG